MRDPDAPEAGAQMLSGECRIDAIPINGQAVLIDGLRLRLDLRLAPSPAAAKASDNRQRTGSALLPRRVQQLAALGGLAALLTALAIWFTGGTSAPAPHERRAAQPIAALPSISAPPPAPAIRAAAAPPLAEQATPQVQVPQVVPVTSRPPPAVAKSPAPARPVAPRPPAARPPASDREMLDLFGDTK